ncbi:MAG: proline dehydrogenase family protein [Gemmatimonadaceae bacterium]
MSLARKLLIRASRSQWLAEQFRRRAFARRAVRRFMPGEELGAALEASAEFSRLNIGSLLTNLGERVTTPGEGAAVRERYLTALASIRARALPAQISVKLTHLGLDADRDLCTQNLLALAGEAVKTGSFVWIDMEESHYVAATLEAFRRARAEHSNVGVCIQAYLRRTQADIDALLSLAPSIRLVKGAYNEPASIAYTSKSDVDAQYFMLAKRLLDRAAHGGAPAVFGTHDMRLITRIREHASAIGAEKTAYEIHMLYGIRASDQRALAADGCVVRVLISYGTAWFPWFMRRLAERPSNVWFVLRNLVGGG